MSDSVHFKLPYNGQTRRFFFTHSNEFLPLAVKLKALSITGPLSENERLMWKDANSISHPMETPEDLAKAVEDAKFVNETKERKLPPCVHLEVAAAPAVEENEVRVESEYRDLADVSTTLVLPVVPGMKPSFRQALANYYHKLQQQMIDYVLLQQQLLTTYRETLREDEAVYREQQRFQLENYRINILNALKLRTNVWKTQRKQYRLKLQENEEALINHQHQKMIAHLAFLRQNEADFMEEVKRRIRDHREHYQKMLEDYKRYWDRREQRERSTANGVPQVTAADNMMLSTLKLTSISASDEHKLTIILPDLNNLPESDKQLVIEYHQQLEEQLAGYKQQQRDVEVTYLEYLKQNEAEYVKRQQKELAAYEEYLARHEASLARNGQSIPKETHVRQIQELVEDQVQLMAEHLATFRPGVEDLQKELSENMIESVKNLQNALDDYKQQLSATEKVEKSYRAGKKIVSTTRTRCFPKLR